MVARAMEVITLIPPVLCPDFLAILALRRNPTIDQKPRQTSSQPSPPAIWMVWVPIHALYMWLTLKVTHDSQQAVVESTALFALIHSRSSKHC